MTGKRLKPAIRKAEILEAALVLAAKCGYLQVTRNEIAEAAGVSGPAVQYHFGTVGQLRTEIMRHAIKQKNLRVIAQGLAARNRHAEKLDDKLKRQALNTML